MSDKEEILERALRKTLKNGWQPDLGVLFVNKTSKQAAKYIAGSRIPELFIFNHSFAKALWGEHESADPMTVTIRPGETVRTPAPKNLGWQHHLQQMVVSDDPIKYLGDNI